MLCFDSLPACLHLYLVYGHVRFHRRALLPRKGAGAHWMPPEKRLSIREKPNKQEGMGWASGLSKKTKQETGREGPLCGASPARCALPWPYTFGSHACSFAIAVLTCCPAVLPHDTAWPGGAALNGLGSMPSALPTVQLSSFTKRTEVHAPPAGTSQSAFLAHG